MTDNEDPTYDETDIVRQAAKRLQIPIRHGPPFIRQQFDGGGGQIVSGLRWGDEDSELVLIHGRGQNAHTWDTVALRLAIPLLALDLPGHGHSDWRDDHDYSAQSNAAALATVIKAAAPNAKAVVGMSLGGKTNISLAATHPDLVRRAVVVDSTPATGDDRPALTKVQQGATALLEGPRVFESFDAMLQAAIKAAPSRSIESLYDGVRHNSKRLDDHHWTWRYDPMNVASARALDVPSLWDDLEAMRAPIMLVIGEDSGRVREEDVANVLKRQPSARIEHVANAGHSVQSDQPDHLAALIRDFLTVSTS